MDLFNDENGVSETVGYILIFGIVFTCIGILLVMGNQIIGSTETQTSFQGIQQSFNVLTSDISQTAFQATPVRTMQVRYDGTLSFIPGGNTITVSRSDGTQTQTYKPGVIRFDSKGLKQNIEIENGALATNFGDTNNSQLTTTPRMYVANDTKTLFISIIDLQGNSTLQGGSGVSNIKLTYLGSNIAAPIDTSGTHQVEFTIKTNSTAAWTTYINSEFANFNPVITIDYTQHPAVITVIMGVNSATSNYRIDKVTAVSYHIKVQMS